MYAPVNCAQRHMEASAVSCIKQQIDWAKHPTVSCIQPQVYTVMNSIQPYMEASAVKRVQQQVDWVKHEAMNSIQQEMDRQRM